MPRFEVAGEVQLGIEVVGADHRHRPPRSRPQPPWATSSTSAAVERQDREHGTRELHGRASAGELVEVAAATGPAGAATATSGPLAEVYAALWFGALLAAAGELPDPFPPPMEELARRYFEVCPPEAKA